MAEVHHPAALRNRGPILEQMAALLPQEPSGLALEVASGTGAHIEVYAPAFPRLTFQPSEYVPDKPASEDEQWAQYGKIGSRSGLNELACLDAHGCKKFTNVLPAVPLDLSVAWESWPAAVTENEGRFNLMVCSNVLHISPWECTVGLMNGGGKALVSGGHLFVYGPFKLDGAFFGDDGGAGNAAFDQKLRETNPVWAIRDVEKVSEAAAAARLKLEHQVRMPANNLLLHFVKE